MGLEIAERHDNYHGNYRGRFMAMSRSRELFPANHLP